MHISYKIHINNQSSESRTHSCLLILQDFLLIRNWFMKWIFRSDFSWLYLSIQGHFFFVQRYWIEKQLLLLTFFENFILNYKSPTGFSLRAVSEVKVSQFSSKLVKVAFQIGLMRLSFLQTDEPIFFFFHFKGLKTCQIRTWSSSECS